MGQDPASLPSTYCMPLSGFRSYAVISIVSDEHSDVARPWPGGANAMGGQASYHAECKAIGASLPTCGHRGVPCRGVVPERRHASGAAMDACHGTTAWPRRAERVADGSVVDVPRALAVPPRAPCINAQRVARLHPYSTCNCLPPKQ